MIRTIESFNICQKIKLLHFFFCVWIGSLIFDMRNFKPCYVISKHSCSTSFVRKGQIMCSTFCKILSIQLCYDHDMFVLSFLCFNVIIMFKIFFAKKIIVVNETELNMLAYNTELQILTAGVQFTWRKPRVYCRCFPLILHNPTHWQAHCCSVIDTMSSSIYSMKLQLFKVEIL